MYTITPIYIHMVYTYKVTHTDGSKMIGVVFVIVVTWARVIYLICMPKARGPQARGLRAYISGKSRVPMLQLLCNTFLASCAQAKSSVELQQLYL